MAEHVVCNPLGPIPMSLFESAYIELSAIEVGLA